MYVELQHGKTASAMPPFRLQKTVFQRPERHLSEAKRYHPDLVEVTRARHRTPLMPAPKPPGNAGGCTLTAAHLFASAAGIQHLLFIGTFHLRRIYFNGHMQKKYQNILAYSDYLPYLCTRNNNDRVGGIAQLVRAHDS